MSGPAVPGPSTRALGAQTLAVLVTAGVTPFLPHSLRALRNQTVPPDVLLVVDVASRVNGLGDGTPVEEAVAASRVDDVTDVRIVHVPEASGFGGAVSRGLERYAELVAAGNRRRGPRGQDAGGLLGTAGDGLRDRSEDRLTGPTGALSPITPAEEARAAASGDPARAEAPGQSWLWLLHDDSAPGADCLEELATAVVAARSVALAGPKQVDWDRPEELLEVGLRTTASARRANDIVEGEIDQGQYDDRSDVLAVGTAGALIDRAVWDQLEGTSALFPVFGDGLELSRAVRLAGHRVIVVPRALLRHRRASYLGLRPAQGTRRTRSAGQEPGVPAPLRDPDPDRSFHARRTAQLTAWATFSTHPVPVLLVWFVLLGSARALWRLVTKEPALAGDELGAAVTVAGRGPGIRAGRRRLAAHQEVRRSVLARLYVEPTEIRSMRRDRRRQERERLARAAAPSELELRELAALARRRRRVLGSVVALVVGLTVMGFSGLLLTRSLTGGALAGLSAPWRQTWEAAWSSWAASADGYPGTPTPLLALLALAGAVASWVGGDGDVLVHALLLAALPVAAAGAWFAAGCVTRRTGLRAWAALAWALSPVLLLGVGQGRLSAVLVHLTLPWALTALARAVGADRRDVVLSGLVDAHHATSREKAELDRFASERMEDLATLADDADDPGDAGDAGDADDTARDTGAADPAESADEAATADEAETGAQDRGPGDDESDATDEAEDTVDEDFAADRRGAPALGAAARAALTERYGPGSPTAAAVAGLLLAVVVAAAPATAALIVPGLLLLALRSPRSALRLLLTVVPVLATAAPAWLTALGLLGDEGTSWALRYLLTDLGVPVEVPAPSAIELVVGLPLDLESLVGAPLLSLAVKALLVVVPLTALLGLLVPGRRGARARAGVLMALGGLALAALSTRTTTAVGTLPDGTDSVTVHGWAGTGLSLALAGLLAAALAGADAARADLVGRAVGPRHAVALVVAVLALLGPVVCGASWALSARTSSAAGSDALVMALRGAGQQVPVIASQMQSSQAAGRVLVLTSSDDATGEGIVVHSWRGPGTQLTDVVPDVVAAQLRDRVPAAGEEPLTGATSTDPLPTELDDPADAELADVVARAVAGQDEQVAADLAAHGVSVVLLTDRAADDMTATARAGLSSTPGLEELAWTTTGASWRVAPQDGTEAARAVLVGPEGTTVLPWSSTDLRTRIEGSGTTRTLVLAERADSGWSATLGGEDLRATTVRDGSGQWRQAFEVPARDGELVVTHDAPATTLLVRIVQVTWVVTAIAALPLRRRRSEA
ncbi:glycosyltransferase [Actinomyces howellii]|uniref:Glycosyl transferase family 2 n=1 Tax=Actinomyces howellii TaxID=52771 RepID=A0A3S4SPD0_9ACTO|nr:glycosyltransferase [Actinomyces howellii]VEG29917.1 Uncharacterised protein [Actinomyces howellii]